MPNKKSKKEALKKLQRKYYGTGHPDAEQVQYDDEGQPIHEPKKKKEGSRKESLKKMREQGYKSK